MLDPADEQRIPRQRWRLRFERDESAAGLTQREEADAWTQAIGRSGLPLVTAGDPPRPRLSLGPPLPVGCRALDEPLELFLHRRLSIHEVRTSLEAIVPAGHRMTGIHDVWPGATALQAAGRAVDYEIRAQGSTPDRLGAAASALLAATALPRERVRGSRTVTYDLRPLIDSIAIEPIASERAGDGTPDADRSWSGIRCVIRFRGRLDPDRGVARPDELLAALGEHIATPIVATDIARTRVWLADDASPRPYELTGPSRSARRV